MILHTLAGEPFGIPIVPAAGLLLTAGAYARGTKRTRDVSRPAAFIAGWFVLAVALASPLHAAGERLLSMHMIQHVLIMSVAAPLIVWSTPVAALLRGVPAPARGTCVRAFRITSPARRRLTSVSTAGILQITLLWLWHMPALYQAGVRHAAVHALQHSTLLVAALLFWASIPLHEHGERVRHTGSDRHAHVLPAIASLFLTTLLMGALSALFTFSRVPWYGVYVTHGAAAAVADQQLAGVIMWVPGALPYMAVALMFVWRVLRRREWHPPLIVNRPLNQHASHCVALLLMAAIAATVGACDRPSYAEGSAIAHGDAHRGQALIKSYGCVACHMVPGVPGGRALVGPKLSGFKNRNYIAGVTPNSPENLQKWIEDPKAVDKLTAMPNVGVTPRDARDIAAYLYSLK